LFWQLAYATQSAFCEQAELIDGVQPPSAPVTSVSQMSQGSPASGEPASCEEEQSVFAHWVWHKPWVPLGGEQMQSEHALFQLFDPVGWVLSQQL